LHVARSALNGFRQIRYLHPEILNESTAERRKKAVQRVPSLAELQALLGHSTSMMTMKYAHLAPGHLKAKSSVVSFGAVSGMAPFQKVLRITGNGS
jgi:hypothetical protein